MSNSTLNRTEWLDAKAGRSRLVALGAGFAGGTAAVLALTEATRLVGLMTPMDNVGLFALDFEQAAVWGAIAGLFALIAGVPKGTPAKLRFCLTISAIAMIILFGFVGLAGKMNGRFSPELIRAAAPLILSGPLTGLLFIGFATQFNSFAEKRWGDDR